MSGHERDQHRGRQPAAGIVEDHDDGLRVERPPPEDRRWMIGIEGIR